ncbi:hypothetical protein Agub_g1763 [Astrephomene gubernaculifera]|uniref:Uncharacterized protein n=1 Tax=Astrephomene gubernaculifera TaxID=47775 RepID=A0AAD3HH42_9CHLO|nr:hypothetical protein Agub_g1763 [Astrephomene gubernaculifera]
MEVTAARVANMMLRRSGSRKDGFDKVAALGTMFSQWSPRDPMRRMTMGGAPPQLETPAAAATECIPDAVCQLAPRSSLTIQDSVLSPKAALLSPTTSFKDGASLLSPRTSLSMAGMEALLVSAGRGLSDTPQQSGTVTITPSPLACSS